MYKNTSPVGIVRQGFFLDRRGFRVDLYPSGCYTLISKSPSVLARVSSMIRYWDVFSLLNYRSGGRRAENSLLCSVEKPYGTRSEEISRCVSYPTGGDT
jgi:hypothetical protein